MKKLLILNLSILFLCTSMHMQINSEECKKILLGNPNDLFGDPHPRFPKVLHIAYYVGSGNDRSIRWLDLSEDASKVIERGNKEGQLPCNVEIAEASYGSEGTRRSSFVNPNKNVTDIFKQKMK